MQQLLGSEKRTETPSFFTPSSPPRPPQLLLLYKQVWAPASMHFPVPHLGYSSINLYMAASDLCSFPTFASREGPLSLLMKRFCFIASIPLLAT